MAIDTSGQKDWVKSLTSWGSRPSMGISQGAHLSWTGDSGQAVEIRYTLDSSLAFFDGTGIGGAPETSDIKDVSASQTQIQAILDTITDVANITFTYVETNPDLVFAAADLAGTAAPYRTVLEVQNQTIQKADIYLNDLPSSAYDPGGTGIGSLMHEVLHVLGISHPNEPSRPLNDGGDTNFDNSLTAVSDISSKINGDDDTATPMPYDIAALQFLYGANTSTNTGDTEYVIAVSENEEFLQVEIDGNAFVADLASFWDVSGTDTYKIQETITQDAVIDLRAGKVPKDAPLGEESFWYTRGSAYYSGIYFDSSDIGGASREALITITNPFPEGGDVGQGLIENAKGAKGDDGIFGNTLSNNLWGNAGKDYVAGYQGDDFLYADEKIEGDTYHGGGEFLAVSGDGIDKLEYKSVESGVTVEWTEVEARTAIGYDTGAIAGNRTEDTIISIEKLYLTDAKDHVILPGLPSYDLELDGRMDGGALDILDFTGATQGVTIDVIMGKAANDKVTFSNFEHFVGGSGNDVFIDASGSHKYDGGVSGIDTVNYVQQDNLFTSNNQSGIKIHADLAAGFVERSFILGGGREIDDIENIEQIISGSGDDTFKGQEGLVGQGFTANGETTERGDKIDFSDYVAINGGVTITLGDTGTDSDGGSYTTLEGIEQVVGTTKVDNLTGDSFSNWLFGNGGIDVLRGEGGDDHIIGGNGGDFLYGGGGDDTFYFSFNSQQSLWHQNDNDTIEDVSGNNDIAYLLGGYTFNPNDYSENLGQFNINNVASTATTTDLEWVEFSDGTKFGVDRLILEESLATTGTINGNQLDGDGASNSLTASAGIILVNALAGDDWLYGVTANDLTLDGGSGSDYLFGASGNTLDGGSGNDYMDGQLNANINYKVSSGIDVIKDFGGNGNLEISGSYSLWKADNGSLVVDHSGAQTADQVIASQDKVVILNHFSGGGIETINDTDITTIIASQGFEHLGTKIDDILVGDAGGDNFSASEGDDVYDGGTGANQFNFSVNDTGSTTVKTTVDSNTDLLIFNGLSQNDVSVIRDASIGTDNLLFSYGQSFVVVEDAVFDTANADHINVQFGVNGSPVTFASLDLTTRGSNGDDILEGDVPGFSIDDIIYGGAGNDTIDAGEGADTIDAGAGDDIVETGTGSDTVIDSAGDDTYSLGKGDHIFLNGSGSDRIEYDGKSASAGDPLETFVVHFPNTFSLNDIIVTTDTTETGFINVAYGGNDVDIQSSFTPILEFDGGAQFNINEFTLTTNGSGSDENITDFVYLDQNRSQNDIINGGGGDDDIAVINGGDDIVFGGAGNDTISQSDDLFPTTGSIEFYGEEGNDVLSTMTLSGSLFGGSGDDTLISNDTTDTLDGGEGDDWISAGNGMDDIIGGAGDDIILGLLGGAKTIDAGDGNDLIVLDSDADDTVDGGSGLDIVSFEGAFGFSIADIDLSAQTANIDGTTYSYSNIEGAIGSYGNDTITGNSANNILDGGTGFGAFSGNDTLRGEAGNDTYVFGTPFEVRVPPHQQGSGNPPAPIVGDDIVDDSSGSSDSIEFTDFFSLSDLSFNQAGNNLVISFTNGSVTIIDHFGSGEIENLILGDGTTLDLNDYNNWTLGTSNSDTLSASSAGEAIYALADDDTVNAHSGGSSLHGGLGDDTLNGSSGNDILNGGFGDDIISGGAGDDTYFFAAGDGIDQITDTSGFDILSIGDAIVLDDLTFTQVGNDLQIDIASGVNIKDFYSGNTDLLIEEIHFDDGSIYDLTSLINTAPVAADDSFSGDEDSVITGNLLLDNGSGNDNDPDGDLLRVIENTFITGNGVVSLEADGSFNYFPNSGFSGQDSFNYTLEDGKGGNDIGTVTIDIAASAPESPEAINIASTGFNSYSDNQDAGGVASLIYSATGAALDGNAWKKIVVPMQYDVTSDTYITFEYKSTIEGEIQGFGLDNDDVYNTGPQPFKLFGTQSGGSTFIDDYEYTGAGDWQYFSINVGAHQTGLINYLTFINDHDAQPQNGNGYYRNVVLYERDPGTINVAPQAVIDEFEGAIDTNIVGNLFDDNFHGLDFDVDNDALNAVAETIVTTNGSVTILANGDFTYTPDAGFSGTDSFIYTLEDSNGASDTTTATLFVGTTDADETFTTSGIYEHYNGGAGIDLVDYSTSATRVKLNLGAGIGWDGDANDDTYVHVENVIGTDIAGDRDFIYGSESENYIWGLAGNDQLEGMGGADTIDGGAGSDYANYGRSDAGVTVNLKTNVHTGGDAEGDNLISIENITGSKYDDNITGSDGGNKLYAGSGDDLIYGGAGNDTLYGENGADTFIYGAIDTIGYIDTIDDFSLSEGDILDLSDVISSYDPVTDAITDFIQITDNGNNSIVSVDTDGGADNFVHIATLKDITGLTDEAALETAGTLITV